MEGMLQSSVLYVIKLGFEMVNAKFFRILDKNARVINITPYSEKLKLHPLSRNFKFNHNQLGIWMT